MNQIIDVQEEKKKTQRKDSENRTKRKTSNGSDKTRRAEAERKRTTNRNTTGEVRKKQVTNKERIKDSEIIKRDTKYEPEIVKQNVNKTKENKTKK